MRTLTNSARLCRMLLPSLLLATALPVLAEPNDKAEPAAEYTLQVNGNKLPLTLGNEVASKVAGQLIRFKLTRQPFREFNKSGVQFQYPVNYGFEVDDSDPSVTVWTVSGGDSILMLNRFSKMPLPELSSDIIGEITKQFGAKNVVVTPLTLYLKGRNIAGKRLNITLAGQKLVQDIFAFGTAKNSFVLVIQDVPTNGKPSAENTKLKVLLTQSLKWK
ncbi:hypothetical protein EON80_03815 [bacterium]|nr:MAG: hypothetical protein EON80_03815 [bacterium]